MKRIIRLCFVCTILIITLLAGCYKADVSTLYSRQYVLAESLKDINAKIDVINGDIKSLYELYETLKDKPVVSKIEYAVLTGNDTIGVTVTLGDKDFYVPFGKYGLTPRIGSKGNWVIGNTDTGVPARGQDGKDGKDGIVPHVDANGNWFIGDKDTGIPAKGKDGQDGQDGVTPTIAISSDGYWVVNGKKTSYKATGTDGKDGGIPIVGAAQDTSNPADQNFYWTIKYPNKKAEFLIINGQKIRANGIDGQDGKQGPQGEPGTESFVTNIEEAPDGTKITITTKNGDKFVVPITKIDFKLLSSGIADANNIINYDDAAQIIEVPYTSSDNIKSIRSVLPTGWSAEPVISSDPTKRVIKIKAPLLVDLDRAMFDGDAVFYGLDDKGAVLTQFVKLSLKKKLYISYFYNPLKSIDRVSPSTPSNKLELPNNALLYQYFLKLEGTDYVNTSHSGHSSTNEPLATNIRKYPAYSFPKTAAEDNYQMITTIHNPDSLGLFNANTYFGAQNKGLCFRVNFYDNNHYHPIPYNTYMKRYSYTLNNGSNNELIRLERTAAKINIYVADFIKWLDLDPSETFDLNKVTILMTKTVGAISSDLVKTGMYITEVHSNAMTHDNKTKAFTCDFSVICIGSTDFQIDFLYNGVAKKRWKSPLGIYDLIGIDHKANFRLNLKETPPNNSNEYTDYMSIINNANNKVIYKNGTVIDL